MDGIRDIVIHGLKNHHHTHQYVHATLYQQCRFLWPSKRVHWCNCVHEWLPIVESLDTTLVFVSPTHDFRMMKYHEWNAFPAEPMYVVHVDDEDPTAGISSAMDRFLRHAKTVRRLVWWLCREKYMGLRYGETCLDARGFTACCLPWPVHDVFSVEDIGPPMRVPGRFCFWGTIWPVTFDTVVSLVEYVEASSHGVELLIKGRMVNLTREQERWLYQAPRRCPRIQFEPYSEVYPERNTWTHVLQTFGPCTRLPLQGDAHRHTYCSTRVLEAMVAGQCMVTTTPVVHRLFPEALFDTSIHALMRAYEALLQDPDAWLATWTRQRDAFAAIMLGDSHPLVQLAKWLP